MIFGSCTGYQILYLSEFSALAIERHRAKNPSEHFPLKHNRSLHLSHSHIELWLLLHFDKVWLGLWINLNSSGPPDHWECGGFAACLLLFLACNVQGKAVLLGNSLPSKTRRQSYKNSTYNEIGIDMRKSVQIVSERILYASLCE